MSSTTTDNNLWKTRRIVQVDGAWTVEGRPRSTYKLLRMEQPANIPGKTFIAMLITLPPGAATPPHIHNGAAVYAQVINGRVISQMIHPASRDAADGDVETPTHDSGVGFYESGQMWYEAPGCRHVRSENASDHEEASFFANFIIDTDKLKGTDESTVASVLTILDVDPRSPHYISPA